LLGTIRIVEPEGDSRLARNDGPLGDEMQFQSHP
jgi:hypothetical protein